MPGTAAIRRRTVSANVTGTATPNERSSVQPSAVFCSSPACTIAASNSSTKNGRPSARGTSASTNAAGTGRPPRQPAATVETSSVVSLRSCRRETERRAARSWTRDKASVGSSSRSEIRHRIGWSAMLSARYSTTSTVSASAQCRSSSTSTQPTPAFTAASTLSTASPSTTTDTSPGGSPERRHSGISRPRIGRNGANSGACGGPDRRRWENIASASGRRAFGRSRPTARPISTGTRRAPASAAASRTRRDLPTPASPRTTSVVP